MSLITANLEETLEEVKTLIESLLSPRKVFVTSETYSPDIVAEADQRGGSFVATEELQAADYLCQELADSQSLPGTFVAWPSNDSVNAIDRLLVTNSVEYQRVDGVRIANNKVDLIDGSIEHRINRDETGALVATGKVWTGTYQDRTSHSANCNGWTPPYDGLPGLIGFSGIVYDQWTHGPMYNCALYDLHLYCFPK